MHKDAAHHRALWTCVIDRSRLYQSWSDVCLPVVVGRVFTTHDRPYAYQSSGKAVAQFLQGKKALEGENHGADPHEPFTRPNSSLESGRERTPDSAGYANFAANSA